MTSYLRALCASSALALVMAGTPARARALTWEPSWPKFRTSEYVATGALGAASYRDCAEDPSFDPLCDDSKTAAFPSGHSTAAFTAAGLSCAHHTQLSLYGDRYRDDAACGLSLLLAAVTGSLRVVGDRHYVSDVVAGAVLGFGVGFGLPLLMHYRAGAGEQVQVSKVGLDAPANARSIAWAGTF